MDHVQLRCLPGSRSALGKSRKLLPGCVCEGVRVCACVRVCVCVCVNTRALSSRPLTLPVTRLRTEPPLKYSTRHRHGSVWGHLLAALILSSVGTSPRTLLRPSPGAAPEKWCWRPCARGGPGRFPADTRPLPGGITALAVSSLPPRGRRTEALYLQAAI